MHRHVGLGSSKVDEKELVLLANRSKADICRFDVSMDYVILVKTLECLQHVDEEAVTSSDVELHPRTLPQPLNC
jgi:hypothetical protein